MTSALFRIDVPDTALADLRGRLDRTRLPEPGCGEPWDYGISMPYLKGLVTEWQTEYDWRLHEQRLNALPQMEIVVGRTPVHVVHVRGRGDPAAPLLLLHGWPGTYLELVELLGQLSDPVAHGADSTDAFDLVLPSAPGFLFSRPLDTAGLSSKTVAGLWLELMTTLGYERFFVHGTGIGAEVATQMARRAPGRVAALYLTNRANPAVEEEEPAAHQERTRPRTLAYALGDSPAGLAAWILSRMRSNQDGEPEPAIERGQLLTLVTLWWVTGSVGTALQFGYADMPLDPARTRAPTAIGRFAGGFPGFEHPGLLAERLRSFLRPLRELV